MNQQQLFEPTHRELRRFGLIFGLMLIAVFVLLVPWLNGTASRMWPWLLASLFWLAAVFWPRMLWLFYVLWMKLATVINAVVTAVLLGIAYYLLISPMAVVMKLMGKDPLARCWSANLQSYRTPSQTSANDMEKPF